MINDNVICYFPFRDEATLVGSNHLLHKLFKSIHHCFCDDLIANVAETDGPKLRRLIQIFKFLNERNNGVVESFNHLSCPEKVQS